MELELLRSILSENGLFAGLTVGLIVWQSKTNNDREQRYLDTIDNISDRIGTKVEKIENDIEDIKINLRK